MCSLAHSLNIVSLATKGSNTSPYEASSDVEEEGRHNTTQVPPYFRGTQICLRIDPLDFRPVRGANGNATFADIGIRSPFIYEKLVAIWVQAWTDLSLSLDCNLSIAGSSDVVSHWPFDLLRLKHCDDATSQIAFGLVRNVSLFLPLILKSIGLRCFQAQTTRLVVPMTFLDDEHIRLLVLLVESIALGLMREALGGSGGVANSDQTLMKALSGSDFVMDFVIGLLGMIHPSQIETVLLAYFNIFEQCEQQTVERGSKDDSLRRCKCSRQLRLHAIERLAAVPSFTKVNYPVKFTDSYHRRKAKKASWANQTKQADEPGTHDEQWNAVARIPEAFWLSELLMSQCLVICNVSCETIVREAKEQARATKYGRTIEKALSRDDLLRLESLAFHSIVVAYEHLIKRHAMDSRFQSIPCGYRIAALFLRPLIHHSVDAASQLARMDPDQKVRLIWLLCLLYCLQESPDAMLRRELQALCQVRSLIKMPTNLVFEVSITLSTLEWPVE